MATRGLEQQGRLAASRLSRFFCRRCRQGVEAAAPPPGWLRVQVRDPEQERKDGRLYVTRGLYCGAACLAEAATGWAAAESDISQDRCR